MPTSIRVLTYNTHLFAGTLAATFGRVLRNMEFEDETRLAGILRKIQEINPDLVGLTEVWAKSSRQRIIDGLRHLYPHFYADELGGFKVGSGLLLLSRHPLSSSSFTRYESLQGSDGWSNKGFILTTAHLGSVKLLVALTHTQANSDDAAARARWSNLTALHAALKRSEFAQMPTVVLGDLNVVAEHAGGEPTGEYQDLSRLMVELQLADAFRKVSPSAVSHRGYTWDAEGNQLVGYFDKREGRNRLKQRLDYMFVRGLRPSACHVLSDFLYQALQDGREMDLSDHYPLYGDFTLAEG